MRILYLISAFTYAGAEKLVFNLALRMAERHDIGIIALYERHDQAESDMLAALTKKGIATEILGKRAGRDRLQSVVQIYRYIVKKRIDLIHAHCPVPMGLGKIAGMLTHIPVICTVHNTRGYEWERMTAWMVEAYISIGEAAERYMKEELKLPDSRVFRIYNAVETERFKEGRKSDHFWDLYGGAGAEQIILNVGRVCSQKNQMCLIKALEQIIARGNTQVMLYILGNYEENDPVYQQLAQYIYAHALQNYVRFLGARDNVEDFLANADCFVMTSWYEGFSVAFLEAVISGCAVVAADLPFVRELNAFAECAVVIPPNDAGRLADVLSQRDYQKQSSMTIEAFTEKFSLERFVEKHCEVYENVHGKKKNRRKL